MGCNIIVDEGVEENFERIVNAGYNTDKKVDFYAENSLNFENNVSLNQLESFPIIDLKDIKHEELNIEEFKREFLEPNQIVKSENDRILDIVKDCSDSDNQSTSSNGKNTFSVSSGYSLLDVNIDNAYIFKSEDAIGVGNSERAGKKDSSTNASLNSDFEELKFNLQDVVSFEKSKNSAENLNDDFEELNKNEISSGM